MRIICKVYKSNINPYRLGIDLPRDVELYEGNEVVIEGLGAPSIALENTNWFYVRKTIEDSSVSDWIVENNLGHTGRENISLVRFDLEHDDNQRITRLIYRGISDYKRVRSSRGSYIDQEGNVIRATDPNML